MTVAHLRGDALLCSQARLHQQSRVGCAQRQNRWSHRPRLNWRCQCLRALAQGKRSVGLRRGGDLRAPDTQGAPRRVCAHAAGERAGLGRDPSGFRPAVIDDARAPKTSNTKTSNLKPSNPTHLSTACVRGDSRATTARACEYTCAAWEESAPGRPECRSAVCTMERWTWGGWVGLTEAKSARTDTAFHGGIESRSKLLPSHPALSPHS